jgi:putative CocE/NonD family hydrolase
MRTKLKYIVAANVMVALLSSTPAAAQRYSERPTKLVTPDQGSSYVRRAVEIPMRDGVKLHTIILIPKGAQGAGILLTRTPYNAESMTKYRASTDLGVAIDGYDSAPDVVTEGGYIRVFQDVRGKYGSKGIYMMNPPLHGTALNPTKTDDSTDSYDTIDWLVKNLPESNGRVGVMGISYDGFLSLMPLVNPHPALKVAVPMNPMVDGWMGDDWFHNGAFRQQNLPYIWEQVATADNSNPWLNPTYDDYDQYMRAGNVGTLAKLHGLDQIGFWSKIAAHPAYDSFWQAQAMDKILAGRPLTVPVMLVDSQWDQEDIYGAMAVYTALAPKDVNHDKVFLTMGPWYHGQEIGEADHLGNIRWGSDTALWWRRNVLSPFLAHYLKGTPMDVAPVTVYRSGDDVWERRDRWPAAPASSRLFLKPGGALGFDPVGGAVQTADYVSDPATPVTYVPRPVEPTGYADDHWTSWLTTDQRAVSSRPDVLTFTSDVLTQPVTISGQPVVHLTASTSGTDSDWVVKLIDVYPDQVPVHPRMGGYQFAVAMDILRGRYREGFDTARPIAANAPLAYQFALPNANHVFKPGHRIMVQVQSSWFPLYDRNPQTFVPNIFFAPAQAYQKATQKITVAGSDESYVALPVIH